MTTVFLALLFVLLAIAFFLIILLYTRLSHLKDVEQKQSKMIQEMEHAITGFLMEMKEENEAFFQKISEMSHDLGNSKDDGEDISLPDKQRQHKSSVQPAPKPDKLNKATFDVKEASLTSYDLKDLLQTEDDGARQIGKEVAYTPPAKPKNKKAVPGHKINNEIVPEAPVKEPTLEEKVFSLEKQGYTIEEIAKNLKKGRTEIELLLKFRQK